MRQFRSYRIYVRFDNSVPIEVTRVSCSLQETDNFKFWLLIRGTKEDADREVNRIKKELNVTKVTGYKHYLERIHDEYSKVR